MSAKEIAGLEILKSKYCTVTFKDDIPVVNVSENESLIKAGVPYLLRKPDPLRVMVFFSDDAGNSAIVAGLSTDLVESSTCDYKNEGLAYESVFFAETAIYPNAMLLGDPSCVMKLGEVVDAKEGINSCTKSTCAVKFAGMEARCGIDSGYAEHTSRKVFRK